MSRALDIANWIILYRADEMAAPVDPMSLEKLVYYAQAFHLALHGEGLFSEEMRAWRHGPVVREVYRQYCGSSLPIDEPRGQVPSLDHETENFLIDVVQVFGGLTAFNLSDATHEEKPWLEARRGYGRGDSSDVLIPNGSMQEYYACLIDQGEDALSRQELLSVIDEPRWGAMYEAGICVNGIRKHPMYDPFLAKKLCEPVEDIGGLPSDLYAPIRGNDYLDLGDIDGLSGEEIVRRALSLSRQ